MFDDGMGDAMGSKNTCKTFSTKFFDWIRQSVGIFSRQKLSRKSPFLLRKKA